MTRRRTPRRKMEKTLEKSHLPSWRAPPSQCMSTAGSLIKVNLIACPPSYGVHTMVCHQTEAGFRPECVAIRASKRNISNGKSAILDKSLDVWSEPIHVCCMRRRSMNGPDKLCGTKERNVITLRCFHVRDRSRERAFCTASKVNQWHLRSKFIPIVAACL